MEEIIEVLRPLVNNRVYPGIAPLNAPLPLITYFHTGGAVLMTFCGPVNRRQYTVQFNVWSLREKEAHDVMESLRAKLVVPPFYGVPETEAIDLYDDQTRQFGQRLELTFWTKRPTVVAAVGEAAGTGAADQQ